MNDSEYMSKKTTRLSQNLLIYLLFNAASIIHILIVWLFPNTYNNFLIHFIYNITSLFIIIPANIIEFSLGILYYQLPVFDNRIFYISVLLSSFLFNFFIKNLIFSQTVQGTYQKYLKPHPSLTKIGIIMVLLLFAFG